MTIIFSVEAMERYEEAAYGTRYAQRLLAYAAPFLRSGQPVPEPVAGMMAKAFEDAAAASERSALQTLGNGLHLSAGHRRTQSPPHYVVGEVYWAARDSKQDHLNAIASVAEQFGCSERSVSGKLAIYNNARALATQ